MFSSGIGGGGFMIVRNPVPCSSQREKGVSHCAEHFEIDFRETGPSLSNATMYVDNPLSSKFGGLAIGVPGEVKGLEEAWNRFGSKKEGLGWKDLIEPVARIAEEGWIISAELDRRMQVMTRLLGDFLTREPEWAAIFSDKATGELKREGDIMRRTAYAKSLREIGQKGSDVFYHGHMAHSMVHAAQKHGGILLASDLARYSVNVKPALRGDWFGRRVWTTNAPSSGPVLLSSLRMLSHFTDFVRRPMSYDVLSAHRFIEAMKFSSGQRTYLGDPAFLNTAARRKIRQIGGSENESHRLFKKIHDEHTHEIDYYEPLFDVREDHGTMSLSVADADGVACSITSTVNLPFGSQVMDWETGIILNNEMDDSSTPGEPNAFGLWPSPYNYPAPFKRPLSSMAPTIIEKADGSFLLTLGGSGGSRIYGSVLQTLLNLDWGLDLSDAIEHPRLHHQLLPHEISVETGYRQDVLNGLMAKGHNCTLIDINNAVAEIQAVMHVGVGRHAVFHAASDSRKQGVAAAF
ncbi:gamma-glutamyltranspeptidase [Tilletiaria anomala UBC 951]|uniref:Gamma-glutamyltranspeptidase n=1 Tax=Tilletiaria anomala (strain ATCC 24038 / CBS 436.72 / UBC 951) TaxID=1037660 RepID=A0A066VQV3_TILAU|nr:gamma-glutamyltranspeptidase [Tilletiaria anomala UBC 951]KDN44127.1 gamma-glutamyltranspeptidase [Tilletiaria anomala UBC 951]